MILDALASLLKESFEVLGVVSDGRSLLEETARLKPDVIVTDVFMPGLNGIDALRQLKNNGFAGNVVVLTMHAEPRLAAEAFRAGALGFVSKECAGEELVEAIRHASQGRAYLTPLIARDVLGVLMDSRNEIYTSLPGLTVRQREVLQLVAEGKTMKEVADVLKISVRTAETHKYETMQILGVQTTAELVQWAIKLRLITIG